MSEEKKKLKILACPANKGGCAYYRIIMPMEKLAELYPDDVEVRFNYDPLDAEGAKDREGKLLPPEDCEDLNWCDIVMFQNIHNYGGPYTIDILKYARTLGKFSHYDTDDLLTDLYDGHRLVNVYKEQQLDEMTKVLYANSDMVSVTQRKFAERIQEYVGKALVIIKNAIDYQLPCWNAPRAEVPKRMGKHTRIGWAGGIHHEEDVKEFRSVAMGVNSKVGHHNVTWNFFGRPPKGGADKDDWQQEVWDNYEKSLSFGVKNNKNVLFHGAMASDQYGLMFRGLDIAIAPLQMNAFNDSKSEIKAMEAGRFGIPLVASDVGCYDEIIKNGETGYLIPPDNPRSEWVKVLTKLCKDKDLRNHLGANLKKITDEYYDINKVVGGRLELYHQVIDIKEKATANVKYKGLPGSE